MESESVETIVDLAATLASRADEIEQVLVLYSLKTGGAFSLDNNLTAQQSYIMTGRFQHWLLSALAGKPDAKD